MADISQLEVNGTTYNICDATARDSLSQYVLKAGDKMPGDSYLWARNFTMWDETNSGFCGILFKSANRHGYVLKNFANVGDGNGDALVIGNGGLLCIGGGESAINTYNAEIASGNYTPGSETTFITSDNGIMFYSSVTETTKQKARFTTTGHFFIDFLNADTTLANNGISANENHNYSCIDKNGNYMSYLETTAYTNGNVALVLKARKPVSGTNVNCGVSFIVDKDGNRSVSLDTTAAWRTALNINDMNYTNTIANVITAASGVRIVSAGAAKWGRVVTIAIEFYFTSDLSVPASGNITNRTVGTLTDNYKPYMTVVAMSSGDSAGQAYYSLSSNGTITMTACEGTGTARTITGNSTDNTFYCRGTFLSYQWQS